MAPNHQENIEECKSIFPTWRTLIGILSGAILTIGSACWYAGSNLAQLTYIETDHEKRLTKLESVQSDIDTIKYMVRRLNNVNH